MDHDTSFVRELQRLVCNFIQDTLPQIKHIEYWSNDWAGFMNLCNHGNEFGFDAIWLFFTTSHSKQVLLGCQNSEEDSTNKFEKTCNKSNLDFQSGGEFFNKNIIGITFFSIYKKDLVFVREVLNARYSLSNSAANKYSSAGHHEQKNKKTTS